MLRTLLAAAALGAAGTAFAAAPVSDNLVIDGSFESAVLPTGTWGFYGGDSLYGWTSSSGTGDNIEVRNDVVGTAQDGSYFVELDSENHNSAMSQTLATVAGQTYTLSFWYSNRAQSDDLNAVFPGGVVPASSNGLSFDLGSGAVAVPALAANTGTDNDWHLYTTSFTATGATTLTFAATGTSDTWGTSLDNIQVTPVPEPATMALMASGLLVLLGLGRRRSRGLLPR